jgi:hypothetical protein
VTLLIKQFVRLGKSTEKLGNEGEAGQAVEQGGARKVVIPAWLAAGSKRSGFGSPVLPGQSTLRMEMGGKAAK